MEAFLEDLGDEACSVQTSDRVTRSKKEPVAAAGGPSTSAGPSTSPKPSTSGHGVEPFPSPSPSPPPQKIPTPSFEDVVALDSDLEELPQAPSDDEENGIYAGEEDVDDNFIPEIAESDPLEMVASRTKDGRRKSDPKGK